MRDEIDRHANADLSHALILFVGYGNNAWPGAHAEAVADAFGPERGRFLVEQATELIAEANAISVDWSTVSLAQAGDLVRSAIAGKHPDLTPKALDALRWTWTFDQR